MVGDLLDTDSDAGVVMAHGFPGDRSEWGYFDFIADSLHGKGFKVLKFDFSGVGESEDEPISIDKQVQDLEAAVEILKSENAEKIGLFGHSQGGLVSLRNHSLADALVLTSPITSPIENYAENRLSSSQRKELEENGKWTVSRRKESRKEYVVDGSIIDEKETINQRKLLQNVKEPVKIIHGDQDEVIPLEDSVRAVKLLETSELKIIEGLGHDYDKKLDQVAKEAEKWFQKYLCN